MNEIRLLEWSLMDGGRLLMERYKPSGASATRETLILYLLGLGKYKMHSTCIGDDGVKMDT